MMFVSIAMLIILYLMLTKTRTGLIVQASLSILIWYKLWVNVPKVFILICKLISLVVVFLVICLSQNLVWLCRGYNCICCCSFWWYRVAFRCIYCIIDNCFVQTFFVALDYSVLDLTNSLNITITENSSFMVFFQLQWLKLLLYSPI